MYPTLLKPCHSLQNSLGEGRAGFQSLLSVLLVPTAQHFKNQLTKHADILALSVMGQELDRNLLFVYYSYVKTTPVELNGYVHKCGILIFFAQNNSYIIQNNSSCKGPQECSSTTSYSEQCQLWGQTRPILCPLRVIP